MQPTILRQGAHRFPLTTKSGKIDYYKGTRQAYLPGTSLRTGPPGTHIISGTGKYKLDDTKVRYYVAPPAAVLNNTQLKPFVYVAEGEAQSIPKDYKSRDPARERAERKLLPSYPKLPPFQPTLRTQMPSTVDPEVIWELSPRETRKTDMKKYTKEYRVLPIEQKTALIMQARREWWAGLTEEYGPKAEDSAGR